MLCLGFQSTVGINSKQKWGIEIAELKLNDCSVAAKRGSFQGALGMEMEI